MAARRVYYITALTLFLLGIPIISYFAYSNEIGAITITGDAVSFTNSPLNVTTLTLNTAGLTTGTQFGTGANYTVNFTTLACNGSAGNLVKITAGSTFSLFTKSGPAMVSLDYVHMTNTGATGGADFYAGANSTDNGGNSVWRFEAAPSTTIKDFDLVTYANTKTFDGLAIASVKTWNGRT